MNVMAAMQRTRGQANMFPVAFMRSWKQLRMVPEDILEVRLSRTTFHLKVRRTERPKTVDAFLQSVNEKCLQGDNRPSEECRT